MIETWEFFIGRNKLVGRGIRGAIILPTMARVGPLILILWSRALWIVGLCAWRWRNPLSHTWFGFQTLIWIAQLTEEALIQTSVYAVVEWKCIWPSFKVWGSSSSITAHQSTHVRSSVCSIQPLTYDEALSPTIIIQTRSSSATVELYAVSSTHPYFRCTNTLFFFYI